MISAEQANARLDEFATLEKDWDSYGGDPPSARAVAMAREWIDRYPNYLMHVTPYAGGILVDWGVTNAVELDVANDGTLGYCLLVHLYSEKNNATAGEVGALIEHFARAERREGKA